MSKKKRECLVIYLLLTVCLMAVFLLCICVGSVGVPLKETVKILSGRAGDSKYASIIMSIRLPRVMNVCLVGAGLSLAGCAMQGILRNPLADGSTLGVSSGASLGAVTAIALGITIPGAPYGAAALFAMASAFVSMMLILFLSYAMDNSLSTNSIILMGVIFSMFFSSLTSLVISFAGEKVRNITFWTMGSLSGTNFSHTILLAAAVLVCGAVIISFRRELDAFSMGEENTCHIGINVRRVKLIIMAAVSVLIGVCVSVGGTIGFVGLIVPHMVRLVTGPSHRRTLPSSLFAGAVFLMLSDLLARTLLSPVEIPIGVITSLVGAAAFVTIFYRSRKAKQHA